MSYKYKYSAHVRKSPPPAPDVPRVLPRAIAADIGDSDTPRSTQYASGDTFILDLFERATSAIMGVERTLTSKFHRRPSTGSCKDMLGNHGLGRFFARLHPVTWHRIKNLHRLL